MEKKKVDSYLTGYSHPDPFEIGRWYERLSQEKMDEFLRKEEEERKRMLENPPKVKYNNEEDDCFYGDIIAIFAANRGES